MYEKAKGGNIGVTGSAFDHNEETTKMSEPRVEGPSGGSADGSNEAGRPRVLQVLPRLDADGATRSAIDISRAVIEAGGTAVIASSPGGSFVGEFRQAGGIHVEIPIESKLPWQRFKAASVIAAAVAEHGIEVVHAYGRRGARVVRKAGARGGFPFVVSPIGSEGRPPEEWIVREMGDASAIVAASPFVAALVPPDIAAGTVIQTITRGIDTVRFNPAAVSAERLIRQAQAWRADDLPSVMLMPARLTQGKGQDVLVRAMARMTKKDVSCLLVARESDNAAYRDEIGKLIDESGLGGRVRFVDHAADMPVAYMMADVVVTPSRIPEAFNSVAAEAQAMGRPVVATAIGSTPDIVLDGQTGWLVPPDDPAALAGALDHALTLTDHARSILALKSRSYIERNFSLHLMQEQMLELYDSLLERRESAA